MLKDLIQKENNTVRVLLFGRIATNIADSLFYMAILWYFKVTFRSPLILSLVFIADSTIDILAFLFGPLIDRVNTKKLLNYVSLLQIILSIIAVFLFAQKQAVITIVLLLIVYVLSTIGSTLIYPTEEKILPAIINKEKLAKVNGIFQMSYQTLDLFLDALATALITYLSLKSTVIISALVFAIALIFYARLYIPQEFLTAKSEYFTGNYLKDLIKGGQTLAHEEKILFLILPFAVTNLFYGISSVGMPYFASHYLNKSAISYGGLELFSSIGGLLGSLVVAHFTAKEGKLARLVTICLFLAGISVMLEVLIANYLPFLILFFVLSSAFWISIMNINFEVLIQRSFSPHILGRIETINSSIINCMIPIGSFLGGLIVQHFGAGIAILLQGLAEVLTAVFYLIYLR